MMFQTGKAAASTKNAASPAAPGKVELDSASEAPAKGLATAEVTRPARGPPSADGAQIDGMGAIGGPFDKAPSKGLMIGIAVAVAALVLVLFGLVAAKKYGRHEPPPAAVEALVSSQSAADKDSLASLADAEAKVKDAIEQAGARSRFPQGPAQLAQVDVQWADALADQAALLTAKDANESDPAKKAASDQKVVALQTQAKGKLQTTFDALTVAMKADPKSADLELALADYYRAQRSSSNMNQELGKAQALNADDARVALMQGEALAQEEKGAERAVPRLKAALAAAPQSARIHFRLAMANLSMHNNQEALLELKEVLRLSPQHERAKMAMEQLANTDQK